MHSIRVPRIEFGDSNSDCTSCRRPKKSHIRSPKAPKSPKISKLRPTSKSTKSTKTKEPEVKKTKGCTNEDCECEDCECGDGCQCGHSEEEDDDDDVKQLEPPANFNAGQDHTATEPMERKKKQVTVKVGECTNENCECDDCECGSDCKCGPSDKDGKEDKKKHKKHKKKGSRKSHKHRGFGGLDISSFIKGIPYMR